MQKTVGIINSNLNTVINDFLVVENSSFTSLSVTFTSKLNKQHKYYKNKKEKERGEEKRNNISFKVI